MKAKDISGPYQVKQMVHVDVSVEVCFNRLHFLMRLGPATTVDITAKSQRNQYRRCGEKR